MSLMTVSPAHLTVDGRNLGVEGLVDVARNGRSTRLAASARRDIVRTHCMVQDIVAGDRMVYGITTGFGGLSQSKISPDQVSRLQENLVRSHAAGVGSPMPTDVVRAMMLLQANKLAKGFSGVSEQVLDLLLNCLREGIHPIVPTHGSVGASGDLVPLAHVALVLIGEGEAEVDGEIVGSAQALEKRGLAPLKLGAKEGLSLVNGTEASTAMAALAIHDAEHILRTAIVAAAMSVEAMRGDLVPFDCRVQTVRPHPGQGRVAADLRRLMSGSELVGSNGSTSFRVQDPYSIRCIPQVLGASLDALDYCRRVVGIELNSTTDNPLLFSKDHDVVNGGNFHAQPIALVMDFLKMAVSEVASISERRVFLLSDGNRSGLPPFLAHDPGLESGIMIVQNTAASIVAENKVLAHPASIDSIPTSAGVEDHVSMAPIAARHAMKIVENTAMVVAIELFCASQGLSFLEPKHPGDGIRHALARVREIAPPLTTDRSSYADLEALTSLVLSGRIAV